MHYFFYCKTHFIYCITHLFFNEAIHQDFLCASSTHTTFFTAKNTHKENFDGLKEI